MGYWGWPAGLGFRLRAFAAVLNPGLGNGRTLRSPTGEIALSEIQIVFVKVSICPETMRSHPESLRETHFGATATRFESAAGFPPISSGRHLFPGRRKVATKVAREHAQGTVGRTKAAARPKARFLR